MSQQSRVLVVRFLENLFRNHHHLNLLGQNREFLVLDARERRLVTELTHGVLRNRARLDYYVAKTSHLPLNKLDNVVLWILRLALYEIEFLRIPEHASVHQAVELCGALRKTSSGSYVNAVLRSFLRRKPLLPQGRSAHALAVCLSHPEWLVKRYLARYGAGDTESLLRRNNQPPSSFLWVNPFQIKITDFCQSLEAEKITYERYSKLPNCVILDSPNFVQHQLYREGKCFFMDLASQEIAYLAGLEKFQVLGDFCSAPGGKSFILASQKQPSARVFCCDSNFSRLRETRERSKLYTISGLSFINADLRSTAPFQKCFDFLLLDVPCSGLGTLRSSPDIRWKFREEDLSVLHDTQVSLLRNGYAVLRKGGRLIYSTCSTEPEENESVVEEFLVQEKSATRCRDFHRTFPGFHPGECFFAARIQRT